MSQEILTQALKFATSGIIVVPVATDGSKRPGIDSWKKYQEKMPDVSDLMRWFNKPQDGLGLICGAVSGNLEMLELEGRAVAEGIHEQAADIAAASGLGDIWKTINDGYIEVHHLVGCIGYIELVMAMFPAIQRLPEDRVKMAGLKF